MSHDSVTVQVSAGLLRGLKVKNVYGSSYYSFQGIPYAVPPIGDLRFKPPQPVSPWKGVRDAFKGGNIAPQNDFFTKEFVESSSEDCLYLNVYTKSIPDEKSKVEKKPVMFYIHGGGFKSGSGNVDFYGPDFLVTQDVVLVTCNYRLGALGFISLGTKEYPGNNGLKDVVQALKWVQENIGKFGGDSGNVTIFGESAGAAAVEFLLLSKNARNLYHKAITQSGSTLCPWAFTNKGREFAFCLGELLGCKTEDDKTLMEFLKKAKPFELVSKAREVVKKVMPKEKFERTAFLVCAEPESEDCILSKDPMLALADGDYADVPVMTGLTDAEGLIYFDHGIPKFEKDEDYEVFLPSGTPKKLQKELAKKIKNFYFPDGFREDRFIRILSLIYFLNGINHVVETLQKMPTRQSPVYYYVFSFDGENGYMKRLLKAQNYQGVCHCDELGYLFHANAADHVAREGSREYNMIQTMTNLWSNFARNGDPNAKDGEIPVWKPVSEKEKCYMDIGATLGMKKDFLQEDVKFWKEIFQEIRNC